MIDAAYRVEWEHDCMITRGKVLTGHFAHWCSDWDELPIDEKCPEWPCACASTMIRQHNEAVERGDERCIAVGRLSRAGGRAMSHTNRRRVVASGPRKRIVRAKLHGALGTMPGAVTDVGLQPGEARAYSRKQRYTRRVDRHEAKADMRAEVATVEVVLPPCQRHGTRDGDWWHLRHEMCTGSEHISPTVVVFCACPCHEQAKPLARASQPGEGRK